MKNLTPFAEGKQTLPTPKVPSPKFDLSPEQIEEETEGREAGV